MNYFVPDFGQDSEIITSLSDTKEAEAKWKHELQASFKVPKGHPKDYFVPNFGVDTDIKTTHSNLKEAENAWGHQLQASFKVPKGHPKDYFVPNFGVDSDILASQSNLGNAEKRYDHQFYASFKKPKGHPKDYFVPNFGVDHDILTTQANLKEAEKKYGMMQVSENPDGTFQENVQLDASVESDPICSSAGCTQYKHANKKLGYPINYPVPNLGVDKQITETEKSLEWA